MADVFDPLAGILTPEQARKREKRKVQDRIAGAQGSAPARAGFAVGTAFTEGMNRLFGGMSEEERAAISNSRAVARAQDAIGKLKPESFTGPDAQLTRQRAELVEIAKEFRNIGTPEGMSRALQIAQEVSRIDEQIIDRQLNREQLKETQSRVTKLDLENNAFLPGEARDPLPKAQLRRDQLTQELLEAETDGERAVIAQKLDEENENIDRILKGLQTTREELPEKTLGNLDDRMAARIGQIDAMDAAIRTFDLNQFTIAGKADKALLKAQDILGLELSDEDKASLIDATQTVQNVATVSNAVIKELAGSAVSGAEEGRVLAQVIDVKRDSPIQIESKLWKQRLMIKAAQERDFAASEFVNDPNKAREIMFKTPLSEWERRVAEREGLDPTTGKPKTTANTVEFVRDENGNLVRK